MRQLTLYRLVLCATLLFVASEIALAASVRKLERT